MTTTTTAEAGWQAYVDAMTPAQSNRIGALQRWIAAAGPISAVEAEQLAAVVVVAARDARDAAMMAGTIEGSTE